MKCLAPAVLMIVGILGSAASVPRAEKVARQIVIKRSGESTSFTPSALMCWAGDQVTWRNLTTEEHNPGVLNKDETFVAFLETPLKPGSVSHVFSPFAELDKDNKQVPYTIHYRCSLHRNEEGTIQVIPTP
jgi:plastocyanin